MSLLRAGIRVVLVFLVAAAAGVLFASSASALDLNTEVSLADAEVGVPYEFQFEGEEGCAPFHFAYKSGNVPGLVVSDSGKLNGIPTTPGTFTFWVELTDGVPGGACHSPTPSQGEFTLVVAPKIEITAALAGAKVGSAVNTTITATGGGSLRWTLVSGSLPPGLALNRDTGALTGTAGTAGTFPFTVSVSDDKRKATKDFNYVVAAPVSTGGLTVATEVGVPVKSAFASSGGIGPVAWAPGSPLPAGLALDVATGALTGKASAAGTFSVPVIVTDVDGQTAQAPLNLTVARRLAITSRALSAASGKAATIRFAKVGGVGPVIWRVTGKLPRGLSLNRTAGTLKGTPQAKGAFRLTLTATDRLGVKSTRALTLTVR